jgi:protein gp37
MLYRCGGKHCKKRFFWISLIHFARCRTCNFISARCDNCGGVKGAKRSVSSHVAWYRGLGVRKYGIGDYHNPENDVKFIKSTGKLRLVK